MRKGKMLPTNAPKPIPTEFLEKFERHGWQRCERIWGKSTVKAWSLAIGRKRMIEMRKRWLKQEAGR